MKSFSKQTKQKTSLPLDCLVESGNRVIKEIEEHNQARMHMEG